MTARFLARETPERPRRAQAVKNSVTSALVIRSGDVAATLFSLSQMKN